MTKDSILFKLSQSKFRSSFFLTQEDKLYIKKKGIEIIREHAKEFISKRIAPSKIKNDGKQTPFKGHPVFIAQHATATCCRKCINKWHKFELNTELNEVQQKYIVDLIVKWVTLQMNS